MRTADAVSPNLNATVVALILLAVVVLYAALFWVFVHFVRRTISEGPSFALPHATQAETVPS
jgi:Cytochrome bd-type quinol oxidase, subunit 1